MTQTKALRSFGYIKAFRAFLAIFTLSLVLGGCSAEKRALRAIKRAERLSPSMFVTDTITEDVELKIPRVRVQFSTEVPKSDPVVMEKDGVVVSLTPTSTDSLSVEVEVQERDTTVPVPTVVNKLDIPEEAYAPRIPWRGLLWLGFSIVAVLLLAQLIRLFPSGRR